MAGYATSQPNNTAILAPGRTSLTYSALYRQLEYVHTALAEWNLGPGDPVAVLLPKGPEMAVTLAVLPSAATAFPLDPDLSAEEYETLYRRCAAKALILPQGFQHGARAAAERTGLLQVELAIDPDAPAGIFELAAAGGSSEAANGASLGPETAYILSTSGTTSERKLIPYHHDHIVAFAVAMKPFYQFEATDLSLHLVPMYSTNGIEGSLMIPLLGGTAIVCPTAYRADTFYSLLDEYRPTWFTASFTICRDILRRVDQYKLIAAKSRLRFIRSGSGRLEPDEIRRLEDAFHTRVIVAFASTETGTITCNPLPPRAHKIGSVGVPAVNDVRVRDEGGRFVEVGQQGEIVVRGPSVFHGYLDDSAANDQAFADGWYRTGDLGRFDADGFLFLTGRIKEVINSGGEKISPVEIEGILDLHPDVSEGAVFGLPHPTLGEFVVAAVVLISGAHQDEGALMRHIGSRLARKKVPRKFFFVDRLPRTENGKLQRKILRDRFAQKA